MSMTGTWGTAGVRCRMKRGKREGDAISYFKHKSGRVWVVALWDGEERPVCEWGSSLLFKHLGDRTFKADDSFHVHGR